MLSMKWVIVICPNQSLLHFIADMLDAHYQLNMSRHADGANPAENQGAMRLVWAATYGFLASLVHVAFESVVWEVFG